MNSRGFTLINRGTINARQSGFTLIEVLVALALIALLSVVAIPNLRQFSNDEELKNTTETLANVLRTAQSSSLSRIKCDPAHSSTAWKVQLKTLTYLLSADCIDTSTPPVASSITVKTYNYSTNSTPVSSVVIEKINSVCPNPTVDIDIIFSGSAITYTCSGGGAGVAPIILTVRDKNKPTSFKTISISKGGVISVQ